MDEIVYGLGGCEGERGVIVVGTILMVALYLDIRAD